MEGSVSRHQTGHGGVPGVVYRTACQNPGCGFVFELRITPEKAGMLSGPIACPRCRRHGGLLKSEGRIGDKLFAAKLIFRITGGGPSRSEDEEALDSAESSY